MSRHENPEQHTDRYEDPAQRPASEAAEHGPADHQESEGRAGRWPPGTLFVAVVVVLFAGLTILAILGFLASR